jgi:predicted nucleotidyltransferase
VEKATELEVDGLRILVASLDDIIRSKEVAGRPKDRDALEELRSLRDASGAG